MFVPFGVQFLENVPLNRCGKIVSRLLLAEVGLKQMAFLSFQTADSFLLDLTHTFAGQIKFSTDLLKGHFLTSDAEEHLEYFPLAVMQLLEGTVNLLGE